MRHSDIQAYSSVLTIAAAMGAASAPALANVGSPRFIAMGGPTSGANAVSDDGSVVAGFANFGGIAQQAVSWTESGGLHGLGVFIQDSDAQGISGDGQVIVGEARYLSNQARSFRSTQTGPIQTMPMLITGPNSNSWAVNANHDGSVVVGQSSDGNHIQAVRWTSAGVLPLGSLPGTISGEAHGVSADGSIIVGVAGDSGGMSYPFRWTAATGMQSIGYLGPTPVSTAAVNISSDGNVIVGYSFPSTGQQAFRWTQAGGMVGLGDLPGGIVSSVAWGTNHDGSIIVGSSATGTPDQAFVWTQNLGMVSLAQYLTMNGVTGFAGWHFQVAQAISADGTTIVGSGLDPLGRTQGFIAVVPAPSCMASGTIAGMILIRRRRVS